MLSKEKQEILQKVYYSPLTGYKGIKPIYDEVREKNITRQEVADWLKTQDTYTKHIRPKKLTTIKPIIVSKPDYYISMDLVDVSKFSNITGNKGINWLLTAVDVFNKKVYVEPIKTKGDRDTLNGAKKVLEKVNPKILETDNGVEFKNDIFKKYIKEKNIRHLFTRPFQPQSNPIERYNGTLKNRISRYMTANDTKVYIPVLQDIVENINNTKNYTTGYKPNEVNEENIDEVRKNIKKKALERHLITKEPLKEGDKVRKKLVKKGFKKGYEQNWSDEVYEIRKVRKARKQFSRNTYLLKGDDKFYYATDLNRILGEGKNPFIKEKTKREVRPKTGLQKQEEAILRTELPTKPLSKKRKVVEKVEDLPRRTEKPKLQKKVVKKLSPLNYQRIPNGTKVFAYPKDNPNLFPGVIVKMNKRKNAGTYFVLFNDGDEEKFLHPHDIRLGKKKKLKRVELKE